MRRYFLILILVLLISLCGCGGEQRVSKNGAQDSREQAEQADYQEGFIDGYRDGYRAGYSDAPEGERDPEPDTIPDESESYTQGYLDGYHEGYTDGYDDARVKNGTHDDTEEVREAMVSFAKQVSAPGLEFEIKDIVIHGDEAAGIAVCINEAHEDGLVLLKKGESGWYGVNFGTGIKYPDWYQPN